MYRLLQKYQRDSNIVSDIKLVVAKCIKYAHLAFGVNIEAVSNCENFIISDVYTAIAELLEAIDQISAYDNAINLYIKADKLNCAVEINLKCKNVSNSCEIQLDGYDGVPDTIISDDEIETFLKAVVKCLQKSRQYVK